MPRQTIFGELDQLQLGVGEYPAIRLSSDLGIPIQRRNVDEHVIRERVHLQKHVTAAISAELAVGRLLGVEVLDLVLALGDTERIPLYHGYESQSPAADVGAVRAQTIMDLERLLGVLIANRVGVAAAPSRRAKSFAHCLISFPKRRIYTIYAYKH
jgi:hypothetical protein